MRKEEFIRRFMAEFAIQMNADEAASSYFEKQELRDCGPEECAKEEASCWVRN